MNQIGVKKAISEAERFVAAARKYLLAEQAKKESWYGVPKESGACRRASMDLTRALSEMRKPG